LLSRRLRRGGLRLLARMFVGPQFSEDTLNIVQNDGLFFEQLIGHPFEDVPMPLKKLGDLGARLHDYLFYGQVDLPGGFLAEIAMLGDLSSEEDLFFLLAVGEGA
jgi:hypothetical protein